MFKPKFLSRNEVEDIHAASLRVLEEAGVKQRDRSLILPKLNQKYAGHIHLTIPVEIHQALRKHAVRLGRSVPNVCREAVARYIRDNGFRSEFQNLEEWKFLHEDPDQDGESQEGPIGRL